MDRFLDELVKAGFVKRDFIWDLKNGQQRKISRYRLSDNYLRFYLKYIFACALVNGEVLLSFVKASFSFT